MSSAQVTEYQVQLLRYKGETGEMWKAYVVALPHLTAEASSREAVLEKIEKKLAEVVESSEIVTVPVSSREESVASEADIAELKAQLREKGYLHHGIFADDPGALEVFDEIERRRDRQTIGG